MILLPELILIVTGFLLLTTDLIFPCRTHRCFSDFIAGIGALLALITIFLMRDFVDLTPLLGGRFQVNELDLWLKGTLLLATFLTILLGVPSARDRNPLKSRPEFLAILLWTVSGMLFLVSARDLITLYVSLEMATIPLFALTAWSKTKVSAEGALKYLGAGALASAFLLYGLGLLYGLSGSTDLGVIEKTLKVSGALYFAVAVLTAGIGFKMALVPFQMWAPDAYQGAPTVVTAFLSVASKAAGLVLAFQIYYRVLGVNLAEFSILIAILATLTMTWGNLAAILQTNLKRFMAYSSISQAGYLLLGFLSLAVANQQAMVFYMLVYVLTNLAVFAVLILVIEQTGHQGFDSLKGLSQRHPLLALAMMIALFGLAGIPPLAGFVGKFFLFSVAARQGYYWLVAVGAINSTISLYYYLRLVRQMYIEPPAKDAVPLVVPWSTGFALVVASLAGLVLGLIPAIYEGIGLAVLR